jgi:DNA helicase II / ATP-dependent DNA helicase PcrA
MLIIPLCQWTPTGVESLEAAAEEAVREPLRNVLLTAGPGAGKTELLAQRAGYLLQTGLCPAPKRILAISFKRDARSNLKERVELRCGKELSSRFDSMTFDGFAKSILDRFRKGLPDNWRPSNDYQIDYSISRQNQMQEILETALGMGGYNQFQIQQYNARIFEVEHLTKTLFHEIEDQAALLVWDYLLKKLSPSKLTFPMIGRLAEYTLRCNPLLLKAMRQTYAYVFLDEFQDTTQIQYDLTSTCFKNTQSLLTAVGDDKQRIMLWAGAVRNVFEQFIKDFAATPRHLISNYRSIPQLVNIQHSIAQALNPDVLQSVSMVDEQVGGDVCRINVCDDDTTEACTISENILQWIRVDGLQPGEICILVRQTPQRYASKLIDKLQELGIKARIESELQDLLAEPITKLLVSLLKLLVLKKSPVDWKDIIDFLSIAKGGNDGVTGDIENDLGVFLKEKRNLLATNRDWTDESIKELLGVLIDFLILINIQNTFRQYEQGTYLKEIVSSIAGHLANRLSIMPWERTIYDFEGHDSIPVMTLHKSKGLEFHTVVFIGLEDQALWNYNSNPDEETCGFFVAFSRAKKRMIMTASLSRPDRYGHVRTQSIDTVKPLYELLFQAGIEPERVRA